MRVKGGRGRRPLVAERLAKRVLSMAMGKDFRFWGRKERSAEALEETGFRTRVWERRCPTAIRQRRFWSRQRQRRLGSSDSVRQRGNRHSAALFPFARTAAAIRREGFSLGDLPPPFGTHFSAPEHGEWHLAGVSPSIRLGIAVSLSPRRREKWAERKLSDEKCGCFGNFW